MGFLDWLSNGPDKSIDIAENARLRAEAENAYFRLEESAEYIGELERMYAEDKGWTAISYQQQELFSSAGRRKIAELCRAMQIVNPLIKRGLAIRAAYVWGQGVGISARGEKVNEVVQAFLDDPGNRKAFTGAQAHVTLENQLGTDGNVFLSAFANPQTGFVQVRSIDPLEITDQITNPEDKEEVWFYRRDYNERTIEGNYVEKSKWYPALGYTPTQRPAMLQGMAIDWKAVVYHAKANPVGLWGVPDALAAIPFARSYKEFLEDWATLMKALSRIAWRMSGKRRAGQQAREAFRNLDQAGQTFAGDPNTTLEAVPKTGATIDAESGRPLATMVAGALGLPVTTLLADPGQTGARAVAETLDQPTRLEFQGRQEVWTEAKRAIIGYAIDQAVLAPSGPLSGRVVRDSFTQREEVVLENENDRTLIFNWPDLEQEPMESMVTAIAQADSTQKMPPLETMRLLLRALKVRDVDEIVDAWTDEDGNFINPDVTAGDAAVRAYEQGLNVSSALRRNRGDHE